MSPHPDEPPREDDTPREDEVADFELADEPDSGVADDSESGVTDEFEVAFGDEFGADVASELASGEGDDDDPVELEEDEDELLGDEDELLADEERLAEAEQDADAEAEGEVAGEELEDGEGPPPAGERDPLEVLSQETVEADVLTLADDEEERERVAREAAEALEREGAEGGDRAGPSTEEQGVEAAGVAAVEEPDDADAAEPGEPEEAEEEPGEGDEPPKVGVWARFLTASLVIVISMATATSVSILLYLSDIAKGLGGLPDVQDQLEAVEGGDPQNILVLGSDKRADLEEAGRSDTTMLLRIDPDNDAIALLSLPRDLKVNIPGRGIAKLNEAYTLGGPEKTLQVVKQITGLKIHHVVNVDFKGFEQAINAIDCVYVDVDRRYFHTNEGLSIEDYYSEIDIQAGYQLLCGDRALQYVRYRHTDNDIVRAARQQDFLREARQKIGPSRLFRDREDLIDIFKKYTTSDIDDEFTMLDVLKTFLGAADAPVKQIHFQGQLGESYVTASSEQMQKAVEQFLGIQDTPGSLGEEGSGGRSGGGKGDQQKQRKSEQDGPSDSVTIDSAGAGLAWGEKFAPAVEFPVFYPTRLGPGSTIINESREYKIADEDDKIHRAYKLVFSMPGTSIPAEFYGLMGTTWTDPPILENPSETREIGGREYKLFYDGDRLRMVAWSTNRAAYWLSNTLLQSLEEGQMLAIADSMDKVAPPKKKK